MYIRHTLSGMKAWSDLRQHYASEQKAMEALSSGLRINGASDDAAGLAISEKMRAQVAGYEQAERNALDAISLLQTAEGGLSGITSVLQRMRELSVQGANGTLAESDRAGIQEEIIQLTQAVEDLAGTTRFNTKPLLTGNHHPFSFQIGPDAGHTMRVTLKEMTPEKLGIASRSTAGGPFTSERFNRTHVLDVSTSEKAEAALSLLDDALRSVSSERSSVGAYTNRLGHTVRSLGNTAMNLTAAESRIRDADMAKQVMTVMQERAKVQASLFVMSQARVSQASVLKLFQ